MTQKEILEQFEKWYDINGHLYAEVPKTELKHIFFSMWNFGLAYYAVRIQEEKEKKC